jgi:phosphoribosylformylglycinamidine synthase subunit PurS
MIYQVQIKVMPLKVLGGLHNLGMNGVSDVRVGKHITLQIEAGSETDAKAIAEEASKKLLANAVMEYFEIEVIQ